MTGSLCVVELDHHDILEIADLVARSFAKTVALTEWLVPDYAEERIRCLDEQFALQIDRARDHRRLYGIRDTGGSLIAAAVWFSQDGTAPLDPPPGYLSKLRVITRDKARFARFCALDRVFAAGTPLLRHDELFLFAVDPACQSAGLGTQLLTYYLDWADGRSGDRPMQFLFASNKRSAKFYARHRFIADPPVEVPGSGGQLVFPMHRFPPSISDREDAEIASAR